MPGPMRTIVTLTALLALCGAVAPAQNGPISVGERITLHSELLNEDRTILVSLPPGYAQGSIRCPVVYLLDGDTHFLQTVAAARFLADQGLAPDLIVAAVTNTDRARDLTPAAAAPVPEFPTAGGADRFRRFLTTELRPYLEGRYRTEPYRILIGWSFGGLFAVHALFSEPASFDAFITASPSLWWDNKAESAAATKLFESGAPLKKFVYLSHGRENNGIPESVQAFATVLGRKAPSSLRWKLDYFAGDNHASIPARAIYNGLESLFAGWALPEDGFPAAADVEARYAALTREFGFTCRPKEEMINGRAYWLLRTKKDVAAALDLFQYNVRCYPESANVHDSLADACEAAGRTALALESCRTACRLAERNADRRLPTFRKHLADVEAKLAKEGRGGGQEIFEAIKAGDLTKVKSVLGKDPRALKALNPYDQTPLVFSLQSGKAEIAAYLIAGGADVNARDRAHATPLSYAITEGLTDIAKRLIDAKADIDTPAMWDMRPLAFALQFRRLDIANMLLDKGAIVPVAPGEESYRLFFSACENGFTRLAETMLAKGFPIGENQYTRGLPHLAAAGGSAAIVEKLVQLGFAMNRTNELGWTPLHAAAEKGRDQVMAILLDHGADIDARTLSGKSAYNIAVALGQTEAAALLKKKGADLADQKFPLLKGPYLGQGAPGDKPQPFALDIVTTQYMIHGNIVFTPDGREAYWSGTYPAAGSEGLDYQILTMKQENGVWRAPRLAPFCRLEYQDDCPFVAPDGRRIFFLSRRPLRPGGPVADKENIWFADRQGDGWGEPRPAGDETNALAIHWQVSTDLKGDLYFGAQDPDGKTMSDIFISRYANGRYLKPEKLGRTVSSDDFEHSPCVSPDGSYIVFSRASQQRAQLGIFISFKKKDGAWGEAICLNEIVGCPPATQCTAVSPDGKGFFYVSWLSTNWASYWVKSDFVERLRPQ